MKRVASWIVFLLSLVVCSFILSLLSSLIVSIITAIYEGSRGLFWVIILLGGTFGLGILWGLMTLGSTGCIELSQKIAPSKKGTRYKLIGIMFSVLNFLDLVTMLLFNTENKTAATIFLRLVMIAFNIMIVFIGSSRVKEYV